MQPQKQVHLRHFNAAGWTKKAFRPAELTRHCQSLGFGLFCAVEFHGPQILEQIRRMSITEAANSNLIADTWNKQFGPATGRYIQD